MVEYDFSDDVDGQAIDPCCEVDEAVVLLRLLTKTGGKFRGVVL